MSEPNNDHTPAPSPTPTPSPSPSPAPVDPAISTPSPSPAPVFLPEAGDPATRVAQGFLAQNGITPGTPAWDAMQTGNFALAKAVLAEKGVKAGSEYVAILEHGFTTAQAAAAAAKAATAAEVQGVFGSAEAWAEAREFVAKEATDAELAAVNAAMAAGGMQAKAMAQYIKSRFDVFKGVAPGADQGPPVTRAGATPAKNITAREFAAETANLRQRLGPDFEKSPEYRTLANQRAASKAAGY